MREATLRSGGFEVVSVLSPIQARFEIEMGRCGVFVICYRVSKDEAEELTTLFRKNCPDGRVIFVTHPGQKQEVPTGHGYSSSGIKEWGAGPASWERSRQSARF